MVSLVMRVYARLVGDSSGCTFFACTSFATTERDRGRESDGLHELYVIPLTSTDFRTHTHKRDICSFIFIFWGSVFFFSVFFFSETEEDKSKH